MNTENTTAPLATTAEEQPKKRHSKTWLAAQASKGMGWTNDPKFMRPW